MESRSKMKVAFIATVYRHLEAFHLPFINLLQQKGYEVHAYARPDYGKEGVRAQGVICHDIPFQRSPYHLENVKALKALIKGFRDEKFAMIHVHTPVASILGRIAAKIERIPCVIYTAHGFHFFKGAPWSYWMLYYPVERWMARWTDFLITINDEDYQRAKKFKVRKKVLYVPGVGVDINDFTVENEEVRKRKRNELNLSKDDFVILYIAELIDRKNHLQLIQAINNLGEKHCGIKCLIVGDGRNEHYLKEKVRALKLDQQIHFLGFRRDIRELLIASDVVALLSKHEGLPKALLEGLAAGKPILATDTRGNRDLVTHNENGYLVPLHDIEATANAIVQLKENQDKRMEMGLKSKELARRYGLNVILKEMEKIYHQALL